uniref:Tagaturonate reductase n=1 Tax=Roseihalotalea indica TaxID=2867963 RepID=A0AA49JG21_9BACT|nr:tagaturonate reductase [Tunicatimonas sp. TK19036]
MPKINQPFIISKLEEASITPTIQFPKEEFFNYPNRIIQFGSGALLRGLLDHFVDQANRKSLYDGRIAIVNNTRSGRSDRFAEQDGLFTICEEGYEDGKAKRTFYINSSVSGAYPAADHWPEVLAFACQETITTVISNTTEIGITLQEDDDLSGTPPQSFPGKLTAFLHERYKAFSGSADSGMVIIPTELIIDNGDKLKSIVLKLIEINQLEDGFKQWVEEHNIFCNTLVDRIVPGEPDKEKQAALEEELGYEDQLLTVSEIYRLLAIEGNRDQLIRKAPFLQADEGIIIAQDITPYRERKLRILNGGHTISVAAGFLCGLETVYDCMQDEVMSTFISQVIYDEIIPSLEIDQQMAREFAADVLDRFRNPYLNHKLISITLQYTSKMNMRNGLTFQRYYQKTGKVPERLCAGLAAYLLFTRPVAKEDGTYYGEFEGNRYPIRDDQAPYFYDAWQGKNASDIKALVQQILSHSAFWDQDMTPFTERIAYYLIQFDKQGVKATLASIAK